MVKSLSLVFLFLSFISVVYSQVFMIGILNQDLFVYINQTVFSNFTLQLVSLPTLNVSANYDTAKTQLMNYDAIIGKFDFTVASICQDLKLTYFFLGDFISTFPGALLEVGTDLKTEAQMLLIYLTKFNVNYPIRFISDSTNDAITFRTALGESLVSQCNFTPNDNSQTILQCYKSVFQGPVKTNYVFITDISNMNNLDTYIEQSLYLSLPYASMIFFPMVDILSIFPRYFYSGGFLFEISPEPATITQNGTLMQRKAMMAYLQIYASLKAYTKINTTHWSLNNIISPFNSSVILNLIKTTGGVYQSNGQMASKTTNLYTVSNQNLALVSSFTYSNNIWSETPGIQNPATVGSKGVVNTIYILDPTFISEVSTQGGVLIQGFATDLLSYLLPPIQLSYTSVKYTSQPFVGMMSNNSFNGLLGQMTTGNYIMTTFPVPVTASYRSQLTYSNEICNIYYSMLIRQANKTVQYYGLAQPFSPLVWLAILATIIFLSIILWLTNLISPNIADSMDKLTVSNSTFMVFGSFLVAKMLVKPNMFSTQIFYLLIWLGTLLLIASYVANLFVATAFANSTRIQFTTISTLYKQMNYKWAFVNNSYLYNSIMMDMANNVTSTYQLMFIYAKTNWPNNYLIEPENVEQFVLNFTDTGVLNDNLHNLKISLQNCLLTTVVDTTFPVSLAYVLNPSFQNVQDLSNQIMTLRVSGIVDLLLTKYFATGVCPITSVRNGGMNAFDYQDMCGVFILILAGIILSLIVATIEFLLKKGNLQCQRFVKGNSLQFGQVYKAKVKALDKGGVTVDIGRQSCFSQKNDARIYYVPKKNLVAKGKKKDEIPSPTEQGIMIGTTLYLKYLGNNPDDSKRKFIQVSKK